MMAEPVARASSREMPPTARNPARMGTRAANSACCFAFTILAETSSLLTIYPCRKPFDSARPVPSTRTCRTPARLSVSSSTTTTFTWYVPISMPVAMRRAMGRIALHANTKLRQDFSFASLHGTAMSPSFQMQYCVDKQIQHEFAHAHAICGRLFFGFLKTNNNFAATFAERILKDVLCVRLT